MIKISILFSGRGSNAYSILKFILDNKLKFEVDNIICSNNEAEGIKVISKLNFNVKIIDKKSFVSNDKYNSDLIKILNPKKNSLLLLCGYMNKVPENIIKSYNGNIINIHPSLLPKYKGLYTHDKVIANKDLYHGCTTHYVTNDIDCGPLIAQYKIPVNRTDDSTSVAKRLLAVEHILYYKTLKMIENKDIKLENNKVYYKNNILDDPIFFS
ncbi:MAG: phosphoribosylglycinamide formyltransferase [Gammaproteobacteria bacterium]|jgi:phosphoribosylglycinamide formyltransferase 1|nr:phosphoribosylglycinamide formyltransferase [Gammaproteobacteria bacterium]MBT6755090.1 phosphoribosylglycinamide formyltransferase [Gammaproteobacteria bacterium]MBT7523331.1 phosphoribosylglycinamide formyltransferase [Gammaproteobacteria bacterium]MBT7814386.1 phosphoribosylglycinamide formyltransferase [Gammaproteobacteria bacterium]MDA9896629.1 phosphoribosylglycinamide formyltransferase [Gammaproteobacteria bacterium]